MIRAATFPVANGFRSLAMAWLREHGIRFGKPRPYKRRTL